MPVCHSRCGMLENPHCSMAMNAEHRLKFSALHGNSDVSMWVKNFVLRWKTPKQTNKQINKLKQLEISFGMIIKDALGFFHQWDSTSFKKCPNFSLCTFFKNCMIYIIYLHISCFRVALTFRPFHPPMTLLKQNISYRFVGVCMHVKIGILT